ncbi:sugar transferase [Prochlorococcus marinus]|uniref:sugar transferase n=1 Tax=Prochlorococcus marinus TaxID=1219 RepID=UPI00187C3F7E|nr:sugar transferase [Prochlorococcus marinus]
MSIISQFIFKFFFKIAFKKNRHIFVIGDIELIKSKFLPFEKEKLINFNLIKHDNNSISNNLGVSEIIIAKDTLDNNEIDFCNNNSLDGVLIYSVIQWVEKYLNRTPTELLTVLDFYQFNYISLYKTVQLRLKRMSDIVFSLILIFITFPICLIVMLLIKLEDKGPIFYSQKRNGFKCKPFKVLKFRSMKLDAEVNGPQWSKKKDDRVTKIGKIIRISRLDEIPQLLSVIKGDMSLIGPRPERPEIDLMLKEHISLYYQRYSIRPGLSGWAQVNYPYGASVEDARNKLSYDIFYIKNFSFLFDIIIFFKTIKLVFNIKGSEPIS